MLQASGKDPSSANASAAASTLVAQVSTCSYRHVNDHSNLSLSVHLSAELFAYIVRHTF